MKIAFVVHDVGKQKGHDRYVAELATALSDRHDIHLFACTCKDIDETVITFHRVPAIQWPDLLKMVSFIFTATWLLRRRHFDVIHTQGVCSFVQNVTTAHFCQARWRDVYRGLRHIDVSRKRQWYHLLVMSLMVRLEQYLFRPARIPHMIALSEQVKQDLIRYYNRPADTITVIHNGINLDEFHPEHIIRYRQPMRENLGIPPEMFVLIYVGEFKRKGLRQAIEAIGRLPDPGQVLFVVAGGGDTAPYKTQADHLGIGNSVRFVGPQTEIHKYYAMSDALVFPVLYEPFGFVITEAMATGIPVITSAAAGAAEIIKDGEDGLLLQDPGDSKEIARLIQRLVNDPALRARIGRQGRATVETLGWRDFALRVEQVYMRINTCGK